MPKPRLCIWANNMAAGNYVVPQRGDVVDVIDTDRYPGREVLGHPNWRVVDVDVQVDDPIRYMAWLIEPDDAPEGFLRWFRKQTIDLDALESAASKELGRPLAVDDVIVTGPGNIKALTKVKLSLPDPRVIR